MVDGKISRDPKPKNPKPHDNPIHIYTALFFIMTIISGDNTTSSHYEAHSADSYEEAYFYEPGTYMQHLVDLVGTRLQLEDAAPPCRLMDV